MAGKLLDVPFFPQTDNQFNPHGACNVTSVAMCLYFLGIRGDASYPQLEDQLYAYAEINGLDRHSPLDLAKIVKSKGKKDDFNANHTLEAVRKHLDKGFPVIVHGYFTRSGHIVVIRGYTDNGFICNDPYGSYLDGYSSDVNNGNKVFYSTQTIIDTCMPDGQLWAHLISN